MHGYYAKIADLASSLPHEDQTDLTTIHDAGMVPQWALSRVEDHLKQIANLEKAILTLRTIHNTMLPIHRLPMEVLMIIFAYRRLLDPKLTLMQVCRYWREVVIATPQFWANAITTLGPPRHHSHYFKTWITRSRSVPLRIEVKIDHLQLWAMHLPKLANRVTDVAIASIGANDWPFIQKLLRLQWTRLVRFMCPQIVSTSPTTNSRIMINEYDFPQLRFLSIPGCCLTSTSTSSSLRTLEVFYSISDVSTIVAALEKCPKLEFLTFGNFELKRDADAVTRVDVLPMIALPCLKKLDYHTCAETGVEDVLSRLILPHSTQILFNSNHTAILPLESPAFYESAPGTDHLLLGLECAGFDPDESDFESEPEEPLRHNDLLKLIACLYAADWTKLQYELCDPHAQGGINLADVMDSFRTLPITTLSIYTLESLWDPLPKAWMSVILEALPNLRRLEVLREMPLRNKLQAATEFLQAQDERGRDPGDLTLVWTILSPEDWNMDAKEELRDLVDLLKTRRDEGRAPIGKLELRHRDEYNRDILPCHYLSWKDLYDDELAAVAAEFDESVIDELRELVVEVDVLVKSETPGPFRA